jgi:hypothetical protein
MKQLHKSDTNIQKALLNATAATILRNAENSDETLTNELLELWSAYGIEIPEFLTDLDFIDSCFDRGTKFLKITFARFDAKFWEAYDEENGETDGETYEDRKERHYQ